MISALIAAGDPRRAQAEARAAAARLARPRLLTAEQLVLLDVPASSALPVAQRGPRQQHPDCSKCPRAHPSRSGDARRLAMDDDRRGLRKGRATYDSPRGRVLEAVLALADADSDDDAAYHAAWERLRRAAVPWINGENAQDA